jgi:hypothetical protein
LLLGAALKIQGFAFRVVVNIARQASARRRAELDLVAERIRRALLVSMNNRDLSLAIGCRTSEHVHIRVRTASSRAREPIRKGAISIAHNAAQWLSIGPWRHFGMS